MRVAITGSSGYLGRLVLGRLEEESAIEEVLGLDVRPGAQFGKLRFRHQDVRDPGLEAALREFQPDCLVHLAWVFNPSHDGRPAWEVDVLGSRNAFRAAAAAGVPRVVYLSSSTSYGAWPDLPQPIPESTPTRGRPDFAYSAHKAEVEAFLNGFEPDHPELRVTRLRGCIVMGPGMDNFIVGLLRLPAILRTRPLGWDGRINFIHQEDMAEVITRATLEAHPGIFNIGAPDAVPISEVVRLAGRPFYRLPDLVLVPLMALLWRLRLVPAPPSYLHFVRHSWVADVSRMERELGYRARYSSRQAVLDMARARGWVSPGRRSEETFEEMEVS